MTFSIGDKVITNVPDPFTNYPIGTVATVTGFASPKKHYPGFRYRLDNNTRVAWADNELLPFDDLPPERFQLTDQVAMDLVVMGGWINLHTNPELDTFLTFLHETLGFGDIDIFDAVSVSEDGITFNRHATREDFL